MDAFHKRMLQQLLAAVPCVTKRGWYPLLEPSASTLAAVAELVNAGYGTVCTDYSGQWFVPKHADIWEHCHV